MQCKNRFRVKLEEVKVMQVTVEQIANEARTLSAEDLRKLRELVNSILEKKEKNSQMSEEEFAQYLYKKGIIGKPAPITDFSRYENYERVAVEGKPISETIIEERG